MKTKLLAAALLLVPIGAMAEEGFLEPEEVAMLAPVDAVPGLEDYVAPGMDVTKYSKMVLGSVTFFFAEDSKTKAISAEESKQISDALQQAMKDNLKNYFEIVDQPGPDTLLLNLGVVDIKMKNKKRGLLGYTPIGLVVTTAGNLSGSRLVLDQAELQGEWVDSQTGEMGLMFQVSQIEDLDDEKQLTWEDVRLTVNDMASRGLKYRFSQ